MESVDFLVVGAGIAGASAAYELAAQGRVVVLERESQPGYHSTGRSAALYTQTYGPAPIRALTVASWDFYTNPPAGFAEHDMLTPRGALIIGGGDQIDRLDAEYEQGRRLTPSVERYDRGQVLARAPFLRPDYVAGGGVWEPDARDIDVHALHQGYLRGLKARGGRVVTDAEVRALARRDGLWVAETNAGTFAAPVMVNAAGAWADRIAAQVGEPVPLEPIAPMLMITARVAPFIKPVVGATGRTLSFKQFPNGTVLIGGGLLGRAVRDENRTELDFSQVSVNARTVWDLFPSMRGATIVRSWAGIEARMPDDIPVIGPSGTEPDLYHSFGFSAHGFQLGPIVGRITADLITDGATDLPITPFRIGRFAA